MLWDPWTVCEQCFLSLHSKIMWFYYLRAGKKKKNKTKQKTKNAKRELSFQLKSNGHYMFKWVYQTSPKYPSIWFFFFFFLCDLQLRLRLVRVKVFPEKKIFLYVWLHFKKCFGKYFLIFGCVLENTLENTFYTCCSHFLTFSRLPNEYIISFIPQNTNKTQKKIIKSGQMKARSQSMRSRSRSTWSWYRQDRDRDRDRRDCDLDRRSRSARSRLRSWSRSAIAFGAMSGSFSLSLAAFVRLLCFVVFWLSVFLSFARATEII